MTKILAVRLDADTDVELLFAAPKDEGAEAFGVMDDVIEKSEATLSGALDMVRSIAMCAKDKLDGLDVSGIEATVGLKLSGKGKFIIAEATAEATLNVKITLKK